MKRRVKHYKRNKDGKVYSQPWIGYSYRNENGTPDFKREVSLAGFDEETVRRIDMSLRNGISPDTAGSVEFLNAQNIGDSWAAYCIADDLGIVRELEQFEDKHGSALLAMILDRVVQARPHSKLGLWENMPGSALERVVYPQGMPAQLHDYYTALEKIHGQQKSIQQALLGSRETVDRMYLYDITSSYMEGTTCPLANFGYNRDGKKGKMQIVIGLLADSDGRPLAVEVFEGNTCDQSTVMERIDSMRQDFGIDEMVFIGDRGMVTKARRDDLQDDKYQKVKYISGLKRQEFFQFLEDQSHPLQLSLFDRQKLVEVEYEGTRYIMSFNPEKEQEDHAIRLRLIAKTQEKLEMISRSVLAGRLKKPEAIAKRLHRWVNKWNMERFFPYEYAEGKFTYELNQEKLRQYEAIDGFYVLITDVAESELSTSAVRKRYKSLSQVEQAFRTMKTTELFMRPIRHWNPDRVRGHIFVCMLSYLIVWKARDLFAEFISQDEVQEDENQKTACHSLRTVWETLAMGMQIGRLRIAGKITEQLTPLATQTRKILAAGNALPDRKKIKRLKLVG